MTSGALQGLWLLRWLTERETFTEFSFLCLVPITVQTWDSALW